jgi:hypothetical protein
MIYRAARLGPSRMCARTCATLCVSALPSCADATPDPRPALGPQNRQSGPRGRLSSGPGSTKSGPTVATSSFTSASLCKMQSQNAAVGRGREGVVNVPRSTIYRCLYSESSGARRDREGEREREREREAFWTLTEESDKAAQVRRIRHLKAGNGLCMYTRSDWALRPCVRESGGGYVKCIKASHRCRIKPHRIGEPRPR